MHVCSYAAVGGVVLLGFAISWALFPLFVMCACSPVFASNAIRRLFLNMVGCMSILLMI